MDRNASTTAVAMNQLRRLAFRLFGTLAPRAAARWFEHLILTPSRHARHSDAQVGFPEGAHRRIPYGNGWLSWWSWGRGPAVLLLHGWGGRAVHLQEFVEPLLQAGLRVVAFDAPAHGRSDGVRTNLVEYAGAVLQVARSAGPLHGLVAHSFGSPAAAMALQHGLAVNRMVFIAAPVSLARSSHRIAGAIGLPPKVSLLTQRRIESRLGISMAEIETDRVLSNIEIPLLVFHDEHDRDVPLEDGATIVRAAKDAHLVTTSGLGHRRILTNPDVVRQAVEFLRVPASNTGRVSVDAALT